MDYKPISCSLYDQLESYSIKKKNVELIYFDENLCENNISGIIENIYSKNNSEFLKINSTVIRLDKIKSISSK